MTDQASQPAQKNWRKLSQTELQAAILAVLDDPAAGKSLSPQEVAMRLAADEWRGLLPTLKQAGAQLASSGQLQILRKGKPVAPEAARGVLRWRRSLPSDPPATKE